jgi:hypothetical protein
LGIVGNFGNRGKFSIPIRKRGLTMRYLLGALALGAALAGGQPASAYVAGYQQAPWCAVMNMGTGSMYWDCSYASVQACTPNVVAGNRGFCNPNPYFTGYAGPVEHVRRHRRHVRHW